MSAECLQMHLSATACRLPTPERALQPRDSAPSPLLAGIVQGKATVCSVRRQGDFSSVSVSFPPGAAADVQIGASVSINGTCLTVGPLQNLGDGTWPKNVSNPVPAGDRATVTFSIQEHEAYIISLDMGVHQLQ